ncbi:hypothetical protein NECAME_09229, partial [Necator americanus]
MSGLMVCSQDADVDALIDGRKFSRPKKRASVRRSVVDSVELDLYGEDAVAPASAIVDEDELLYGESGVDKKDEGFRKRRRMAEITSVTTGCEESDAIDPNTVEPTYWLILARDSGKIVVHSLPDMSIVYQ